jgi:hypothetical protein
MHRGILLSTDIHSVRLPWAPSYPARSIQSPALSDPLWQFVPWLSFARRELLAGRIPLWNPHQDGGVPLLGNFISALLSPLAWPALLLGADPGWNLSLLLRVLVAAFSAFLFLRDLGRSRLASALGAVVFSLSGPFIAWLEHPQTLAAAPVPLLFLFVRRTVRAPSAGAVCGVAASTFLVLAGGHPETALMAAILAAGVLVVTPGAPRARGAAAGGAVIGAFLAAPALLPSIQYYLLSVARSGEGRRWFVLPFRDLARFVLLRLERSNGIEAAAAVSIVLLLLVPIGLRARRQERETRFWGATSLVILLAVYESPLSRLLGSATPVYWTRLLLFLPLALAVPGSAGLDAVRDVLGRRLGASRSALVAGALTAALVAACGVELLLRATGVHGVNPPGRLAETTPLIERLRSQAPPFRVLPFHTELTPNSATDYGLDDVRGYDALGPAGWRRARAAIGRFHDLSTQRDAIEPWELVPGGAGLDEWNVVYLVAPREYAITPEAWKARTGLDVEEIYAGADGRIWRNLRAKPRVRLDGGGEVTIRERVPGRWRLTVRSSGASPDRLTVADPFFPGWRATLDGVSVPLAAAPGEPMRLPVPPGSHEVELAYRPGSFLAGVVLAAVGAAILVVLALRRPSKSARE